MSLDRILQERLEPFKVPATIRNALRDELLSFFNRPEKKLHGATVFTESASHAADIARQEGKASTSEDARPQTH